MGTMTRFHLILTVLLGLGAQARAETVTWIIHDAPPQYIFDGPLAGQGYKDQQLRFLIAQLPQFQHRVIKGSISRAWHELALNDGICTLGMLPNKEREDAAALAERPVLVPGFRLAIAAGRADRLAPFIDRQGEVDLDQLAGSHRLSGAYLAARVHARAIEDFIALPGRAVPLQQIVSPRQLYALVQTGRVDFTFGGPHEIRYAQRTLDGDATFEALPIRGVPRLVKTYLSCSKKPLGEAVIAAADQALRDPARWAGFLAPLEAWMDGPDFAQALAAQPDH